MLKNKILLIGATVTLVFIIALISLGAYLLKSQSNKTSQSDSTLTLSYSNHTSLLSYTTSSTNNDNVDLTSDKLFYSKNNNVFELDINTQKEIQVSNYPQNKDSYPYYDKNGKEIPNITIGTIRVIDPNTIGYAMCAIVGGDLGCGIYSIDLNTKNITLLKKFDKNIELMDVGFYSTSRFAYLTIYNNQKPASNTWVFTLYDNGKEKTLQNIKIGAYGRDGSPDDSQKIRFSKDGLYLLEIATASPIAIFDSNVYIYNLNNNTNEVITNATEPSWILGDQIIYKKYNSKGKGLYIYDFNTQQDKVIVSDENADNPNVLGGGTFIYNIGPNVWLYNIDQSGGIQRNIITDGNNAVWVSDSKIVYQQIEICKPNESCDPRGGNIKVKDVAIYNLFNKTITPLDSSFTLVNIFSAKYN